MPSTFTLGTSASRTNWLTLPKSLRTIPVRDGLEATVEWFRTGEVRHPAAVA